MKNKPRLYSYTLRYDDGAAPNPFHGMCTLTICKPAIRSSAKPGDWIVGLGGTNAPSGDLSGKLIYAMKVEEVVPLPDYDRRAAVEWPHRIPNIYSKHLSDRLGDCIYDYSHGSASPRQRAGVHGIGDMERDLRGRNALISRHFFYFGSKAINLPEDLLPICHQTHGHKSTSNAPLLPRFEAWLANLHLEVGQLYGWPDHIVKWNLYTNGCVSGCSSNAEDDDDYSVCF